MSNVRAYAVEIEGVAVALVSKVVSGAPLSWATSQVEALLNVPVIQTMGVDPLSGDFQHGGLTLMLGTGHDLLLNRRSVPETYLTAELSAIATTVTVNSTSGFPSSGTIWIEREAISYTGTTATTFTGCTRAKYGTTGVLHPISLGYGAAKNTIFGYNPNLERRRAYIRSYDPGLSSPTATTIASGYIDVITWDSSGLSLSLVSVAQRLDEPAIKAIQLPTGQLRGSITQRVKGGYVIGPTEPHHTDIFWAVDFGTPLDTSPYAWVMVGEELVKYRAITAPEDTVVTTGTGSFGPYMVVTSQVPWQEGDLAEFVDSGSGDTVWVRITAITGAGLTNLYYSDASVAPAAGATVTSVGVYHLQSLIRSRKQPVKHDVGEEIRQVIVIDMDHCDAVMSALMSGSGYGGIYDVLPSGIGMGLSTDEVDVSSFDTLRSYSVPRRLILDGEVSGKDLLTELAQLTGGRIFVTGEGKIKARRDFSPYPDLVYPTAITTENALAIPAWSSSVARIGNYWRWPLADGGEFVFRDERSISKYRIAELPEPKSEALTVADSGLVEVVAMSVMRRCAEPCPEVTVDIAHEETAVEPGSLATITLPHLPDQAGNAGLSGASYEVIEFAPSENQSATVKLLRLPPTGRVGLVAPAGIVSGVAGSVATIYPRSTTHLAPSVAVSSALSGILGGGVDGTEDAHWFLVNDPVQLIDKSTLGNSPPTTATTTITAINYATRQITLAAVPGWLADGDIIRLDTHATVTAGATASQREPYFTAWSDDTPELPSGDESYYWGM